jgi:hypothetical protein
MTAQTGFGALGIFKLDDGSVTDGFLPDAEKTGSHLGDDVITVGDEGVRIAALTGAGEGVQSFSGPGTPYQH